MIGDRLNLNPSPYFDIKKYKKYFNISNDVNSLVHFYSYGKFYLPNFYITDSNYFNKYSKDKIIKNFKSMNERLKLFKIN